VNGRTENPVEEPALATSICIVPPAPHLRGFISAYFSTDIASEKPIADLSVPEWGCLRFVLNGGFDVFRSGSDPFRIDGAYVQGPSSQGLEFHVQNCRMFGVGLIPEGFARFWKLDLGSIADSWMPIETFFDGSLLGLRDALEKTSEPTAQFELADRFFSELLEQRPGNRMWKQVVIVHRALNDPGVSRIEDLAARSGMSASQLARFCKARFGFAPKLLLRRQRFLRMLEALHERPYAEWHNFVDPQYTDQSHMIRDFKSFLGVSPGQYMARSRLIQQASAAARLQALGGALQGLD
jgi:AraC-like DNA-binding protein